MPTQEELSAQLALTTKLAAQVERMSAAADKLEQSFTSQIDAVTKLSAVMNALSAANTTQSIEVLNKSLKDMQDRMKETGKTSESTFQKLGKRVEDTGKTFSQKFPKSVAIGAAALSGFAQGVKNVVSLTKGVTGFFGSFVSGLVNVGASIIAIPFKIFSGLVDMAAKSAGGSNELMAAIESLRKEFGALGGPTNKTIIDMTTSLKGFSDTGLSAWRVFGNMAERLETFHKLATEMGATFVTLRKEFEANGGALLAYQKGLGISDEQMKGVASAAISMGDTLGDTLKEMTKDSLELGKAFGLDAKVLSRDVAKAMNDVKHFAGATTKAITEAATFARKLGLELDKITGTLDAFETFDTAAENVAKLSQAFGVNVDAFQLMEAQDPASQVDILRKSFASAGVDASNFNRQQLKLLASTTGLDEATARQAFSMKNQGVGLDQIQKKGSEAQKKTLTQTEAMEKLAGAIERLTQSGGGMEGGFWDQFVKGIKNGIMSSTEFYGLIRNIQRALRDVYMIGVQLGRVLVKIVPGFHDILSGLSEFFKPKYFDKLFKGISDSVKKFFDPKSNDKDSIPMLVKNLKDTITDFFTAEGPNGKKVLEGFGKFFKMMSTVAAGAITWLSDEIAKGAREVLDLLTGKKKLPTAGAKGAGASGLGFLADVIAPIGMALRHAWTVLKDPIHDLVVKLGQMLKGFLTSKEFIGFIKPALPFLAGVLFGPAFTRSILTALTTSVLKSVVSGGASGVIKKAAVILTKKAATGGAQSGLGSLAGAAGPAALVAAAAAIGAGVNKYTDQITSTLDHSSAVIGAGAAGLIDALTLGLLPDGLSQEIANIAAKGSDIIFGALGSVFGKPFSEGLKRTFASAFEVFGNIWSFFSNLFTGDQASFEKSATELGLSLLRFTVSALEFLLVEVPAWILKVGARILSGIGEMLIKLVTVSTDVIAGGIDKAFGTHLVDKVRAASDSLQSGLAKATDGFIKQQEQATAMISSASGKLQDDFLRSSEDKAKIAAQRAVAAQEGVGKATNDAAKAAADNVGSTAATLSDNLRSVKEVKKQLDDKDFDVAGSVNAIREKLKGISFDIVDPTKLTDLVTSTQNLDKVTEFTSALGNTFSSLKAVTNMIKTAALAPALKAVSEMVAAANKLNDALADGNLNKLDVTAKLGQVATAVGLGGKSSYTVNPSKAVQITLNLEVTMDVDKVEKVLIMRQQSIIRDRLNFATGSPNAQGTTTIPSEFQATLPSVTGGTQ